MKQRTGTTIIVILGLAILSVVCWAILESGELNTCKDVENAYTSLMNEAKGVQAKIASGQLSIEEAKKNEDTWNNKWRRIQARAIQLNCGQ